jgi:hypothetical protein
LRISNLLRHSASSCHLAAVAKLTGASLPLQPRRFPCQDAFKKVLAHTQGGIALRNGVSGVGQKMKVARLGFCLAEAARDRERQFLRTAVSIALHPDTKGKRHGIRYSAADKDMRLLKGSFGHINVIKLGTGAAAIQTATIRLINRFSTPRWGAPLRRHGQAMPAVSMDRELRDRIMDRIEVYDPDGAADEQCAGVSMREHASIFKNLKVVTRDRVHAARRTTGQPRQPPPFHQ